MATFKSKYKRFNGLTWDEFHFETSPEQVIGLQDLLDGKVDKITLKNRVYGTGDSGEQITYDISKGANLNSTVPQRTTSGTIRAANAVVDGDLVPLGQLNTLLLDYGKLVDVVDLSTDQLIEGTKTFDAAVHLNSFLEFKTGSITKNTLKTNPLNDRLHVVQGNGKSGDLALVSEVEDKVSISAFNMQMLEKLNIKPDGSNLLIVGGKINPMYIDSASTGSKHEIVSSQVEMLALVVPKGTVAIRTDEDNKPYILVDEPASTLANWKPFSSGGITGDYIVSINDKSGIINLLAMSDIDGLSQALNLKLDAITFATEVNRLDGLIGNKVDKVTGKALSTNDFTTALKSKLDALDTQAQLTTKFNNKVDKVTGKGLSTEDFTTTLKGKLAGIQTGAQVNPYSKVDLDNKFNSININMETLYGGKNLAIPDLDGKEYLGDGVYRPYNDNGITIDYNVYNGVFELNGTVTKSRVISLANNNTLGELTGQLIYINGEIIPAGGDGWLLRKAGERIYFNGAEGYIKTLEKYDITDNLTFLINGDTVFNNFQFKLQLEKGDTATPYTLPVYVTPELLDTKANITYVDTQIGNIDEYALTKSKIETALKGVGDDSITLGYAASTAGIRSIALGYNASAAGIRSTALGYGTSAKGSYSTALGYNANAEGSRSAALGHQAEALGIFSTAIGQTASASGGGSTALGSGTIAESQSSIAIGVNAKALGNFSIALGAGSKAEGLNSIAIGVSTIVTDDNVADFGEDRQVRVNLAPEHDRDAVSKKYLEDNFVELLKNLPNI